MEFRELLKRRRMVRAFEPEPIPRETIERIVGTLRRAPSGGFSQGARLVVVTDPGLRRQIAEIAHEDEYVAQGFEPWISRAPVHVFIGTREDDYHDRYREPDKVLEDGSEIAWPAPYWYVDAGAVFMLILLAAIDEGLAAGVFGLVPPDDQKLKDLLGVPADVHFVGVVTLGRPAPDPTSAQISSRVRRRRRPIAELVHWEGWND